MSPIYIGTGGERRGPHTKDEIWSMWDEGVLSDTDLYWIEGMAEWRPLRELLHPTSDHPVSDEGDWKTHRFSFTRHPQPLTSFVQVMLCISLCVALISLWSDWLQLELLKDQYTEAEGEANDSRQQIVGLLGLAVTVITGIAFLKWIYRANLNSRGFGAQGMDFTPGWAIGSYFVPILNLFRPYQAMKEIWQVSGNPERWKSEPVSPLLGWWWGLWILASVLGQASFRLMAGAKTIEAFRTATTVSMISAIVDVVLCLVAWVMVSPLD